MRNLFAPFYSYDELRLVFLVVVHFGEVSVDNIIGCFTIGLTTLWGFGLIVRCFGLIFLCLAVCHFTNLHGCLHQGSGLRGLCAESLPTVEAIVSIFGPWNELKGKLVRIGRDGNQIVAMRDILDDTKEVVF